MGINIYLKSVGNHTSIEKSDDNNKLNIKDYPGGIYTTARTWKRKNVYDFLGHINRLTFGLNRIKYIDGHGKIEISEGIVETEEVENAMTPFRNSEQFSVIIKKLLQMAMIAFYQENSKDELKITILVTFNFELMKPEIYIHISELPIQKSDTISVGSALLHRTNAKVKYSQWAKDRSSYEDQLSEKDLNEIVMYDSEGNLYEGLSSNFYIYYNDSIYIAPEDAVLEGTIGKMVFKGCKEMNILVKREFPNINDIKKWSGAFITSTSRLVLPITKFYYKNELYELPVDPTIQSIKKYVSEEIKNASVYIFPELF
ncbi:hypothetical protein BCR32DRAFT_324603 [Anaeromyces robustus]|uniref:D-aminoacid aminotransferase-like PLP-dependent enzyme n=1 Tax=Anaeromyces robustus TaxID=1754192 RepID=A0A1Y1XP65_9FUNG|nr:hypothetical protein BCR32DRAFT_324603 [Anaeromyces robustus]|eukprot:ORX87124.1 hypothetical protein BCR32DRAFT_324603 [Anaeromyces robustus]